MRKILTTLILFTVLLSGCGQAEPAATDTLPTVQLTPCQLIGPDAGMQADAQCGTLQVYEDPTTASGRMIELHFAVLPAISRTSSPDPVFFLAGGPGEAATDSFLMVASAFRDINLNRDIVLVDQRGTGQSNPLSCLGQEDLLVKYENSEDVSGFLTDCLAGLEADPRFYTTSIAMDDLDQVRQALGYDQINLYGVSYGTRAALVYLRQYPDRVRSLILDGVAPPDWSLGENAGSNAQQALDLIFERCLQDASCNSTFPDLPTKFETILDRLAAAPVELSMPDPTTGEVITTTMNAETFATTVFNMSYSSELVSLIPLMVHTTYEHQDYQMAAAQGLATTSDLVSRLSDGMRYSVICSEDEPFYQPGESGEGYIQDTFGESFPEICDVWPHQQVSDDFKQPVQSDIPVLILSGELDPVTPPANGDLAAQTLPNSLHLVIAGQGHVNIYRGCIPSLAANFIRNASIEGLNSACIETIAPLPFFISFSGPQP